MRFLTGSRGNLWLIIDQSILDRLSIFKNHWSYFWRSTNQDQTCYAFNNCESSYFDENLYQLNLYTQIMINRFNSMNRSDMNKSSTCMIISIYLVKSYKTSPNMLAMICDMPSAVNFLKNYYNMIFLAFNIQELGSRNRSISWDLPVKWFASIVKSLTIDWSQKLGCKPGL